MSGIIVLILRILLIAALYGFLIWAFLTIWRDLRAQGHFISAPYIPEISITRMDGEGEDICAFATPEIIIGRSPTTDLPIADETVSSRHARVSYHHNQWWVEDLGSTNGTYLNDERVSVSTVLIAGDELRCGQVSMLIGIKEQ